MLRIIKILFIVLLCLVLAPLALVLLVLLLGLSAVDVVLNFSNYGETSLRLRWGPFVNRLLPKKDSGEEEDGKSNLLSKLYEWYRKRRQKKQVAKAVSDQRKKAEAAKKQGEQGSQTDEAAADDSTGAGKKSRAKRVIGVVITMFPDFLHLFRVRRLQADVTVRGDSPADTGIRYGRVSVGFGVIYPRIIEWFRIGRHRLNFDADFNKKGNTEIKTSFQIRLRPLALLWFALRFAVKCFGPRFGGAEALQTIQSTIHSNSK